MFLLLFRIINFNRNVSLDYPDSLLKIQVYNMNGEFILSFNFLYSYKFK